MEVKYNISRSNSIRGILYDNTHGNLAQMSSPISNKSNQEDKYRALIDKNSATKTRQLVTISRISSMHVYTYMYTLVR